MMWGVPVRMREYPTPPDQRPLPGPKGPRTPYPVNDPDTADPRGPGSEGDVIPGTPSNPPGPM